ncbi:c-type cytochrome [Ilumatobacter nonamiensis]|uniref:c-type cytochrome n=1 Tax=Ilumatobacter nonamiensis TaxID=467093 RepID=UPI00130EAFCA|nr:cytochrome c [Ilumatobacter nonamiensis]
MSTTRRTTSTRPWIAGVATVVLAIGVASCGGGGSELSELAQRGKNTANSNGCASCHGSNGQGGVGPTWVDLAGSEVVLKVPEDEGGGTRTVTADDEYLLRAILEPAVEEVDGYTVKMPTNGLSEAEADDVIAYIKELTSDG